MQLPFSVDEFLDVFRSYNLTVWPAQVVLYLLGLALVVVAVGTRGRGGRNRWVIPGGLALLWAWMGIVYHLTFFSAINPAGRIFGLAFLAQALLWLVWAWRTPELGFQPAGGVGRVVGWVLLAYAFLVYPTLNTLLGHAYPAMPTFGAPCPTTITTLGLLAWATPPPAWFVWVVPMLWVLVGTSAAFTLGVSEDLGLLAAAILVIASRLVARREAMSAS